MCFLRRGVTAAILKDSGKVPSEMAKLMMVVIGVSKESRQDLRRKVGMMSSEDEAEEDERMAFLTSWMSAGRKVEQAGGGGVEVKEEKVCGKSVEETRVEESLQILSWKKLRNEEAIESAEGELGRTGGGRRERRVFSKGQSFLGWLVAAEIAER